MKNTATMALLACLMATSTMWAAAQEREDIIWARDIGDAEITLDGQLDEAVWEQADSVNLVWGERAGLPGSGWRFHGETNVAEPSDPVDATIKLLRKGNQLYIAAVVPDNSIGGSTELWSIDGLVMSFVNRIKYDTIAANPEIHNLFPGNATSEYFVTWWHQADTTETGQPTPGAEPRLHGEFGSPNNVLSKERTAEQVEAWEAATVVNGTTNDDAGDPDEGYVIETRIDLEKLGYDATQVGGDRIPSSFTIYDTDWQWPVDEEERVTSKVWFQSQWGNNLNEGAAIILADPSVTVDTPEGALPEVGPDFVIPNAANTDDPVIDGQLDEDVWQALDYAVQFQYKNPEANENLPGFGRYYTLWFRPNVNDNVAPVVDPSLAKMKFFFKDTRLFIGADVDDQAISGALDEGGDGMSITINHRDLLDGDNTMFQARFIFNVDSTGVMQMSGYATEAPEGSVEAAAALKPKEDDEPSTPGDPTDVDAGYTFEIAIDLVEALSYDENLNDGWVWLGAHLFDTDNFEDPANDYTVRTWWLRERDTGPGVFAYLDAAALVSAEEVAELPEQILLHGNFPNPFNPSTTLRYALPHAGDVTIEVFDVLGRKVTALAAGPQAAGQNEVKFDAAHLASGLYLYRLQVVNQATGTVQSSVAGRMVLLK